jgi:hypothetical protein
MSISLTQVVLGLQQCDLSTVGFLPKGIENPGTTHFQGLLVPRTRRDAGIAGFYGMH